MRDPHDEDSVAWDPEMPPLPPITLPPVMASTITLGTGDGPAKALLLRERGKSGHYLASTWYSESLENQR